MNPEQKKFDFDLNLVAEPHVQKYYQKIAEKVRTEVRIGQAARKELEKQTEGPVYLDLWVKVAANWRKDQAMLKQFGYSR